MKNFILFNWRQKLYSLLLACLVWAWLKESIEPGTFDQIISSFGWRPQ